MTIKELHDRDAYRVSVSKKRIMKKIGLWNNPTPCSKEDAIEMIYSGHLFELVETDEELIACWYSSGDLF